MALFGTGVTLFGTPEKVFGTVVTLHFLALTSLGVGVTLRFPPATGFGLDVTLRFSPVTGLGVAVTAHPPRLFMQLCLQNDNVNFADNGRERKSSELQLRGF